MSGRRARDMDKRRRACRFKRPSLWQSTAVCTLARRMVRHPTSADAPASPMQ